MTIASKRLQLLACSHWNFREAEKQAGLARNERLSPQERVAHAKTGIRLLLQSDSLLAKAQMASAYDVKDI